MGRSVLAKEQCRGEAGTSADSAKVFGGPGPVGEGGYLLVSKGAGAQGADSC